MPADVMIRPAVAADLALAIVCRDFGDRRPEVFVLEVALSRFMKSRRRLRIARRNFGMCVNVNRDKCLGIHAYFSI